MLALLLLLTPLAANAAVEECTTCEATLRACKPIVVYAQCPPTPTCAPRPVVKPKPVVKPAPPTVHRRTVETWETLTPGRSAPAGDCPK